MLLRMALFFLNYPVRISQKSCRATFENLLLNTYDEKPYAKNALMEDWAAARRDAQESGTEDFWGLWARRFAGELHSSAEGVHG